MRSRFGRAIVAIRDDDLRAEALGFPTYRMRLAVFVAAGAIAGIAGALSVNQQGYVSPNLLHWTQSGTLMVMVILGGVASLWGGVLGAAVLVVLQEALSAYTTHWEFWTGWVLLAVVLFARHGLAGWLAGLADEEAMSDAAPATEPLLDVQQLSKRFGGVVASAGVDLRVHEGEVHALIGPNGAGKTTLVAQLAGQVRPDRGRIVFAGRDITHLSPHERARRGLARSFQITRLFKSFDVRDNVVLAVQAAARHGDPAAAGAPAGREAEARRVDEVLAEIGLADKAARAIDALSHGEQRALEVGLAVASRPRLVMLDEPMAGMGHDESKRMEALIRRLRVRTTVLLIEHDVDAVFRLADRVSVLVSGQIIASGAPEAVRRDAGVIEAYLGEE